MFGVCWSRIRPDCCLPAALNQHDRWGLGEPLPGSPSSPPFCMVPFSLIAESLTSRMTCHSRSCLLFGAELGKPEASSAKAYRLPTYSPGRVEALRSRIQCNPTIRVRGDHSQLSQLCRVTPSLGALQGAPFIPTAARHGSRDDPAISIPIPRRNAGSRFFNPA